ALRGSTGTRPRPLTRGPAAVAASPARRAHRFPIVVAASSATRPRSAWRVAARAPRGNALPQEMPIDIVLREQRLGAQPRIDAGLRAMLLDERARGAPDVDLRFHRASNVQGDDPSMDGFAQRC